ncbi:MAG: methyltransferase domain-containing protein [Deltaproteobacteria bacterium]|jgi:methylase of polypeptide subunit release factors|nr:methyltransferase domain-containing protein [Deltaproteobacteria bacterium]
MERDTITWKGRLGPFDLKVGRDTFRPSTVSQLLADAMEIEKDSVVVDAGCGSGVLSIIAAKLGARHVYGVDAANETAEVAGENAAALGVAERTTFFQGDLFEPLPDRLEADVVIGDVSGIPDEIARESGWFPSGLTGGPTGAELPARMLNEARRMLRKGGRIFLPTGSLQDEGSILDTARAAFGSIRQLSERSIPLPSALAEQPAVVQMVKDKVIDLTQRGSRFLWTARVWEVTA